MAVVGCTPLMVLTTRNCSATLCIVYIFDCFAADHFSDNTDWCAYPALLELRKGFAVYLTNPATGSMASVGLWKKECRLKPVKGLELWWGRDEGNKDAKKFHGFEQLLARDAWEWLALQNLLLFRGLQGSFLQAPSHFLMLSC